MGSVKDVAGKFMKHVIPGVARPMRILWNQMIGFLFVVLAVFIIGATVRRAGNLQEDFGAVVLLVSCGGFGLLLGIYGISAFLRARRISRS